MTHHKKTENQTSGKFHAIATGLYKTLCLSLVLVQNI